ncbi:MAG: DISARM system phospholipase D-like protein DrmC [Planctomycetales bacterium]|nr:DISARM system phospholipase D-like protein DrmC [Planctomycetales bacterium]
MDELLEAIALIATTLHRDRIEAIANAAERLEAPVKPDQWSSTVAMGRNVELLVRLTRAWAMNPTITGKEIAFGLRTAGLTATAIGSAESIDLVWTGPKTGLIPTRNTEQAIREVIDEAGKSLFIVSYVFHSASSIVEGLNEATERGVSLHILLESSTRHGGAVSGDSIKGMHQAVPNAELYIWHPNEKAQAAGSLTAAVHAKCAVADHRIAFVTSANLTSAAMERNMELGVLVRGGTTPDRLHKHLNALIQTSTIVPWRR